MAPEPVSAPPGPGARLRGEPVARAVFTGLPARYDRLAYLLSFGQDRRWRRAVVGHAASVSPVRVLDVATGPAGVALAVAARTGADVVGVDLNEAMLRAGAEGVRRADGPGRVTLAVGRADQLPFPDAAFDAVTFSYLLRYVDDPERTVAEMARCLRPGGVLACLEFHVPPRPVWRAGWWCYTRLLLPLLGALAGGRPWYRVGRFLGPSISTHYRAYPLTAQVQAWRRTGMTGIGTDLMSLGGGLVMWGRKAARADGAGMDVHGGMAGAAADSGGAVGGPAGADAGAGADAMGADTGPRHDAATGAGPDQEAARGGPLDSAAPGT